MNSFLRDGKGESKRSIDTLEPASSSKMKRRCRDIDIWLDHILPGHLRDPLEESDFKNPDVYLPFYEDDIESSSTKLVRIHFRLRIMAWRMLYHEKVDMEDDEELEELCMFRIQQTALKSLELKVKSQVGKELISCMHGTDLVFQDHRQVSQFAALTESMGCDTYILRALDTAGLYPPRPPTYKNYICHFYSSIRFLRNPDKIRCGIHLDPALKSYFEMEDDTEGGDDHDKFRGGYLLRDSESGIFSRESECDGLILSTKYKLTRHRVYKAYKPGPEPLSAELRRDYESYVCSYFSGLTISCQGTLNRDRHENYFNSITLQMLSSDSESLRMASDKLRYSKWEYVTWTVTEGVPNFFFDVGSTHTFITLKASHKEVLLRFLRNLQQMDVNKRFCKGIAMQMTRPNEDVSGRMLGAVKVVGVDPVYQDYYIIQPCLDSLLRVLEKLLDESLQLEPHSDFHIIEVPDIYPC